MGRNGIFSFLRIILFLPFLVLACSDCSSWRFESGLDHRGDRDAKLMQRLIEGTVKVEKNVEYSFLDDKKQLQKKSGLFAVGSGVVVAVREASLDGPAESLVLTAEHVCREPPAKLKVGILIELELERSAWSMSVLNVAGKRASGVVLYAEPLDDVCILRISGLVGNPVELAEQLPPLGGKIVHVGGPTGSFGFGLAVSIDGRYGGIEKMGDGAIMCAFGLASAGGSSGGGVYYRGRLFSILTRAAVPTGNVTWGVILHRVKAAVEWSVLLWGRG